MGTSEELRQHAASLVADHGLKPDCLAVRSWRILAEMIASYEDFAAGKDRSAAGHLAVSIDRMWSVIGEIEGPDILSAKCRSAATLSKTTNT